MNLRVVIAEDELPAIAKLRKLLSAIPEVEVIGEARTAPSARELIYTLRPDIAFMDIKMPGGDGLSAVAGIADPPKIVFVTAYPHHAAAAFERRASDYILKPYTMKRLLQVIEQVRAQVRLERLGELLLGESKVTQFPSAEMDRRLVLKIASEVVFVSPGEIECVMAEGNYLHLMTSTRKYFVRGGIALLEHMLPSKTFLRVHRSAIVNVSRICAIAIVSRELRTTSGFRIAVSRARMRRLIAAVDDLGLPSLGARHN